MVEIAREYMARYEKRQKGKLLKILICFLLLGIFVGIVSAIVYNLMLMESNIGVDVS
jgi:hypothetical protein